MATADIAPKDASAIALPGLGRALTAGKLTQKAAEEIYQKSQISRTSFIAELTGSGWCRQPTWHIRYLQFLALHYLIWKPLTSAITERFIGCQDLPSLQSRSTKQT
jgi:hypothetical protein